MSHYLIEVGYTSESWGTQISTQEDVIDRITPMVDHCKGKIESVYYTFGDRDLVAIMQFPTPEDAAAFGLAAAAGGAVKMYRTTPLLTVAQGKQAMKKAATASKVYTPALPINLVDQRRTAKTK